jgi:quercetin dioxygenase-like cupin family protein
MSHAQQCLTTPSLNQVEESQVALSGDKFELKLQNFIQGESVEGGMPTLGEEVGAVLEGTFSVDAAGEHYDLCAGEAIVIPPNEPRAWRCTSASGVLYRAVVRLDAEQASL